MDKLSFFSYECLDKLDDLPKPVKRIRLLHSYCVRVCLYFIIISDAALLGRSVGDFGPSDEEILDQTQIRSFFPETWIYDEKVVG